MNIHSDNFFCWVIQWRFSWFWHFVSLWTFHIWQVCGTNNCLSEFGYAGGSPGLWGEDDDCCTRYTYLKLYQVHMVETVPGTHIKTVPRTHIETVPGIHDWNCARYIWFKMHQVHMIVTPVLCSNQVYLVHNHTRYTQFHLVFRSLLF